MALGAADLVFRLHGELLRDISDSKQVHFQGLRIAASHLWRAGRIKDQTKKKLLTIEAAFSILRHITGVSAADFLSQVREEIGSPAEPLSEPEAVLPELPTVPVFPSIGVDLLKRDADIAKSFEEFDTSGDGGVHYTDGAVQTDVISNNSLLVRGPLELMDAVTVLALDSVLGDLAHRRAVLTERFGDLFGPSAVSLRYRCNVKFVDKRTDVAGLGDLHRARLRIGDLRLRIEELMYEAQCDACVFIRLRDAMRLGSTSPAGGLPDYEISDFLHVWRT
mmetsp:Transcript_81909/g.248408  ORF Transcript_81909/g.248408 Transcript_81909/m.248408 type:complete len:278 (+) Transcript_81909:48-881(+)